ncbi:MAG TPA: carboxypeptidase regulatory-like domain-containing protein [Terracidiphilus sp.]|nr:carboxypeptidase regulatory-like domain-containing protein [Terracidiphilus sp.]
MRHLAKAKCLKAVEVVLVFAVVVMWTSLSASAQTGAGSYRIAGTVVNAVTGEPVRGATVAVLAVEGGGRIAGAQSGNDGRFAIEGLAAGKYQLIASKRGYSTAAYDQHGDFSSAVVTGEGQDTGSLVFRLAPGAVLRGVVSDDGGDPAADAQVMLFERPQGHEPGEKIVQVDTALTDDTGLYEFANLAKGKYLVAVKAEPWYALHRGGGRRESGSEANSALDVAYPITYFDSTTDEAAASPVELGDGSRVEADISLHAVPALQLTVEAPRRQDGSIARPELRQTIFGVPVSAVSAGFMDAIQTGSTELSGVAPGHYELTQGDPPRVVVLDAANSQHVEPGAGIPAFAVSGALQTATGARLTGQAVVTLEPADNSQGLKPMVSAFNQGSFSFAAVPAGAWKLRVEQAGLREAVLSIGVGGRLRTGNVVAVQDRPQTLLVRVSADGMRVEGFARKGEAGFAGAMVLLVPRDRGAFPDLVRRDQSDSDGSFVLRDAAPGQYTVVAIEDGWGLDWTRPEVIGRYLPGGVSVTVRDTLDKVVRLSGPVGVEQR